MNHTTHIPASDGQEFAARLFSPTAPAERVVVICGAMGVKQSYYAAYAAWLAEQGFAVLTFDYRGIGESGGDQVRDIAAGLQDWAHDLEGALNWARQQYPGLPILALGHSLGGQIIGLTENCEELAGILGIGAQNGYWRIWPGLLKVRQFLLWFGIIPFLSRLGPAFPSGIIGMGETLPNQVARDWAHAGRKSDYLLALFGAADENHYADFNGEFLSLSFSDDNYAPFETVAALLDWYPNASHITHRHISPSEFGLKEIGHFGFFRDAARETLWQRSLNWLRNPDPQSFSLEPSIPNRGDETNEQALPAD